MKVCFCGLGSIGRQHLKNFTRLASAFGMKTEIHALRKTTNALGEDIEKLLTKQVFDTHELDLDYDLAFITNPTSLHFETIKQMAPRAKHLFIEKPVFDSGTYNVEEIKTTPDGVYYVAGPLRYAPVIQALKLNQSPLDGVFDIVVVKDTAVLDIDSEEDFELMEVVAKHLMADGFKEIDAYARTM